MPVPPSCKYHAAIAVSECDTCHCSDLDPPIGTEVEAHLMTAVTSFYGLDIKPEDEASSALIFENINRVLTTLLLKDTSTLRLERMLTVSSTQRLPWQRT